MIDKNHHQKQRQYFDEEFLHASHYTLAPWQKSYIARIKKYILEKDHKGKTLLDIGSGTGYVAIEMAKLGMRVIACDLSAQAIKNLRKYQKELSLPNIRLIQCRAEEIPLKERVDYIVANAILEHIPDEEKAIALWKKLLKKGGKMLVTVPLKFRYIWPFLWPINYLHDKRIGHLRRYDLPTLREKFNLPVVKYFYTGHLIKVFGILLSLFFKSDALAVYIEEQDKKKEHMCFGANNISVIFQKR